MITVAGLTPSLDLTYTVESLRHGQIHRVPETVRCAGGKALNMARASVTAGGSCLVVAVLGGPTGLALAEMLRLEGLDVVVVRCSAETRICVSVASADSDGLTEIYQEAAPVEDSVWQEFHGELERRLRSRTGWLSVSGRAPSGRPTAVAELVETGRRLGVDVAVDVHGEALPLALAGRPALVKINRQEAAELLGVAVEEDLQVMAGQIHTTTGGLVVLTDGAAGALAWDGRQLLRAVAPEVDGRYPVGSGDSFLGGLLASLDRGGSLPDALRTATACGVANAMVPGPGRFAGGDLHELATRVVVEPG